MYKILEYLKYIGLFFLFIIVIAIISSLLNLTGMNSVIVGKLAIILTGISFFVISALASGNSSEKGYVLGIKLSLCFVILMFIINLLMFKSEFKIDRIIYYIILIASSILGGSFGKNININLFRKKKIKKSI